jgi:hypothetical protein
MITVHLSDEHGTPMHAFENGLEMAGHDEAG